MAVLMDPRTAPNGGAPTQADDLRPILPISAVEHLMHWKFGPDGALNVLDYGTGFFNATDTSALWRVTYTGGSPTPTPTISAKPIPADPSPQVAFSGTRSGGAAYTWEFGDGARSTEAEPRHRYAQEGMYSVTFTVQYADRTSETISTRVDVR